MQLADSLNRGILRIIDTVAGALCAWALAHASQHSVPLMALSLVGGVTLYAAITRPHSYAWLLSGLTFSIVLLDSISEPLSGVRQFAQTRVLEVASGTLVFLSLPGRYARVFKGRNIYAAQKTPLPARRRMARRRHTRPRRP